jgi:MoxR-like ATPase
MLTMIKDPPLTQISITEALGVRGWAHLDAVLLAALATEAPLLLVGPHGTAKSLLVERMSAALGLDMRHYNAALINYDDLVGIPLPDESGSQLKFITTPGTIWDAGFVFFDEISRCRSDLQNKLFPIIHERRVVGIKLETLRHRWAAMNPPAPDDLSGEANPQEYYLGSEPLDPALTDRFPFVINVPNWGELSKHDRLDLVAWQNTEPDLSEFNLPGLVARCRQWIPALETDFEEWLGDYIVYMVDLLEQNKLPQSPRRARMLARSVVAVHAARLVLEGEHADPEESAETALIYGLPQNATEVPPSQVQVVAVHKQAWEMNQYLEDDRWRQVMEEYDMARRVALADQLEFTDEEMSRLITQTLGAEDSDARQVGLATAMFLAFRERRDLDPSAYEPLAQLAYHVLEPRLLFPSVAANSGDARTWREITEWITEYKGREDSAMYRLYRNFVLNGFPNMWRDVNWKEALTAFAQDLTLFGIEEVKE